MPTFETYENWQPPNEGWPRNNDDIWRLHDYIHRPQIDHDKRDLRSAEQRLEKLAGQCHALEKELQATKAALTVAQLDINKLVQFAMALIRHVTHLPACPTHASMTDSCTCGLSSMTEMVQKEAARLVLEAMTR